MAKRASAAKEMSAGRPASPRPVVSLVRHGQPHVGGQGGPAAASVFISYSRLDQAVCDQIVRELKERGHAVWLDREAIHGGDGSSARRAITRFVAAFSETLKSYIAWLDSQK
jgi:hypothetical protein